LYQPLKKCCEEAGEYRGNTCYPHFKRIRKYLDTQMQAWLESLSVEYMFVTKYRGANAFVEKIVNPVLYGSHIESILKEEEEKDKQNTK